MFHFLPEGPDRTVSLAAMYSRHPPADERAEARLTRAFDFLLDVIEHEDYVMCEQTQRSFRCGAQRDLVFGRNEPGLIHYHESIEAVLDGAGSRRQPVAHS